MRKRNKPIGLAFALATFVVLGAGLNGLMTGQIKLPDAQPAATSAPRETAPATEVSSDVKNKIAGLASKPGVVAKTPATPVNAATGGDGKSQAAMAMRKSLGGRPLMAVGAPSGAGSTYKPTPNEAGTATQWYEPETKNGSDKGN